MLRLTVRDEGTAPPRERQESTLELPSDRITVRELIRLHVEQRATGDVEAHVAAAIEAFERTRLLLLVDDRQVEDAHEELELRPDSDVTFVRLVPLAGG